MNAYFPAAAKKKSLIWWQLHTIILIDGGSCSAFGVTRRRCWSLRDQFGDLTRQAPSKRKCTRSLFHSGLLCHDHDSAAPSTRIPPAYVNVNNSDNTLRLPNWTYFGSLARSVGRSFTCNNIRKMPMRLKYTLRSKHIFRFRWKCTRASIISSVVGDELPKTSRAVERIIEFLGYRFNWSKARGLVSSPVWLGGWRTARQ